MDEDIRSKNIIYIPPLNNLCKRCLDKIATYIVHEKWYKPHVKGIKDVRIPNLGMAMQALVNMAYDELDYDTEELLNYISVNSNEAKNRDASDCVTERDRWTRIFDGYYIEIGFEDKTSTQDRDIITKCFFDKILKNEDVM